MTNLKILLTIVGTLALYTWIANIIPQVQSAVPMEVVLTAETTPEELAAIGEELYAGVGGCTACHGLGTRAPDLVGVAGSVCATRVEGLACKDYLWQSLTDPMAYVVDGFQPIMLDQSRTLGQAELWALVAFLETQGGTVTVNADDFAGAIAADAAAPPPAPPAAVEIGDDYDPTAALSSYGCMACHSLGGVGAQIGPPFEGLQGKDREYVLRGITNPNADTAPGFEAFAGTMPPTFGDMIPASELEALVDFFIGAGGSGDGSGDQGGAGNDGADGENRP